MGRSCSRPIVPLLYLKDKEYTSRLPCSRSRMSEPSGATVNGQAARRKGNSRIFSSRPVATCTLRIPDGTHKMPVVGEIVIKASDSGVRRTRSAYGRAKTDRVQAVTHGGVVALRQVTPKSTDDRIEPQTARVTGGSVARAAGSRRG